MHTYVSIYIVAQSFQAFDISDNNLFIYFLYKIKFLL